MTDESATNLEDDNLEDDISAAIQVLIDEHKQQMRTEALKKGLVEGHKAGLKDGIQEGIKAFKEGERSLLLRQLRARFGELSAAAVARIEAADSADLERWGVRVLGARTLDEVLDDPS